MSKESEKNWEERKKRDGKKIKFNKCFSFNGRRHFEEMSNDFTIHLIGDWEYINEKKTGWWEYENFLLVDDTFDTGFYIMKVYGKDGKIYYVPQNDDVDLEFLYGPSDDFGYNED